MKIDIIYKKITFSLISIVSTCAITYELYHPLYNIHANYWGIFILNIILIVITAQLTNREEISEFSITEEFYETQDSVIFANQLINLIHILSFLILMNLFDNNRAHIVDLAFLLIFQGIAFISGNKTLLYIVSGISGILDRIFN